MTRLQSLIEALGQALCEKGRRALTGDVAFGDVLPDVAKLSLDYLRKHVTPDEIRVGLGEVAAAAPEAYAAALTKMIDGLARVQSVPFRPALTDYLSHLPGTVRQVFRRPSDPTGRTPPEKLDFYKPEQLLLFLPPRRPRFKAGDAPPGVDHFRLTELLGLGECSEVWLGVDDDNPDEPPSALKFVLGTGTDARDRMKAHTALFEQVFELNEVNGIVPLRQVFLETDPPCLECGFVTGYDLAGLMNEWRWRFDAPKPEATLKLMRRVCEIVGQAHAKGVVHRDLKPSNIRVHPTEGGKFTLWVTDFGMGQIEAVRSIELARGGTPRGEQTRMSYRGSYTPLYASPQQAKKDALDPRDDVHALGVIWYQLLKRDPHAAAPVGEDWAEEFYPTGFTSSSAKLLAACVATRPDKRPKDARHLGQLLHEESVSVPLPAAAADGSKLISLKSQSSTSHTPVFTMRGKPITQDAASRAAASLLGGGATGLGGKFRPTTVAHADAGRTADGLPTLVRNSLGMVFGYVPAGTFEMGAADGEAGKRDHETPRHTVRVAHPFYVSIFPVTQGQFEKLMGQNPSFFHKSAGGGIDLPVDSVRWSDASRFCAKLEKLTDETVNGRRYRLPTEAEWEYACRAGTNTAYACGDRLSEKDAHHKEKIGNKQGKPDPVGQHPANAWGLYDMHGNVGEWVIDWYDEYYYFDSPGVDPKGPANGETKVVRGGSWADPAVDCRSASRKAQHPDRPCNTIGFRVVLVPGE